MSRHSDTIAALATPVGTAALAVIRASGPDTREIVATLCARPSPPRVARHVDYRSQAGELIDDVLLTFFAGPHSYTGEDSLEISCHGNPFIAQKILEDLFVRGCRPAEAGEFTQRAFLNGRMDLSQAEAVMDVIHARSERALAAANQQLRGSLVRRMSDLVERLLGVVARFEAYIDFPDEDLPAEDKVWAKRELAEISTQTSRILATAHYGELLRDGIKTVIVGHPNVGKSSLLNRLVGRDRALVSPEPGTTRDFIEETILVGPHWLRLIDTAGLNHSPAPLEKLGIDKTLERIAEAHLLLVVHDARELPIPMDLSALANDDRALIVLNKSDLCDRVSLLPLPHSISVSARSGFGFDRLVSEIMRRADSFQCEVGSESIAVNARHSNALRLAVEALASALDGIETQLCAELVASELRAALAAYGEIMGRVDNERMLDQLFATFCIGK